MFKVALTGGIGAGKTLVARIFQKMGIKVINTDTIAKQLVEPGSPALTKIQQHFGKTISNSDGSLNRNALRKIIFSDKDAKIWLEALLHPLIWQKVETQLRDSNENYVIIEIPLLVEADLIDKVDRVLVINTSLELQIARIMQRDGIDKKQITKIIAQQIDPRTRMQYANDVIDNNDDIAYLELQVCNLHEMYKEIAVERNQ